MAIWLCEDRISAYFSINPVFRPLAGTLCDEETIPELHLICFSSEPVGFNEVGEIVVKGLIKRRPPSEI